MLEGWKAIAAYISEVTRRDVSTDAIRRAFERDAGLKRIVQKTITGKPATFAYQLNQWIAFQKTRRRSVSRMWQMEFPSLN